jgi:hypothetical protein
MPTNHPPIEVTIVKDANGNERHVCDPNPLIVEPEDTVSWIGVPTTPGTPAPRLIIVYPGLTPFDSNGPFVEGQRLKVRKNVPHHTFFPTTIAADGTVRDTQGDIRTD